MLNNISIKTKLLVLLLVPLVLFAAAGIYLLQLNASNINKLDNVLYATSTRSLTLVLNADRDMYQALTAYQQLSSAFVSPEDKEKAKADFAENVQQTNDRIDQALKIVTEQGIAHLTHANSGKSISDTITEVDRMFNEWVKHAEAQIQAGNYSIAKEAELQREFDEARGNINDFGEILEDYALQQVETIKDDNGQTTLMTYIIMITEWILLLSLGFYLIRKISRTVAIVQAKTKQVADGNLRYEPQAKYDKDELGQILLSVDSMIGKMRGLIGAIAGHAEEVASASNQLADSARESASASSHVAENIQLVSTLVETQTGIARESNMAMEEMAIGVQKIADSTNVISDHSAKTNEMADDGKTMLAALIQQMEQMAATIGNLNDSVAILSKKSDEIGSVTDKITAIANQTGILSLNASIEAVRAGEHGRGFAVVAQEIRKLSATSLESAQAIHQLIDDTRGEIGQASAHMRETVARSEQGAGALSEVARGFESIVSSIKQISRQLHDTSAVTEQMSASSEQVSASLDTSATSAMDISAKAQNISAATEEQLALSENIASASEQLQDIVGQLNGSIRYFKL
ncbi:HAMP domain-containing protein [Cohnella sp. LGH]|uniref:methyl-accepting chemotaxis protein n=1 Tax=Cohnella sp. LGH TaxID=1619153 RepID=UPI001ADAA1B5|nr:methyl-accepting chemotaxis protein [Cohnella sp. LGH]QTH43698.1 HAMP domain-containing protein [Cohnella sp. LGH]